MQKSNFVGSRWHCLHVGIMLRLVNRLTQGSFAACSKMSVSRDIRTRDMFAFPSPCVRDFDEMACSFYSYPCSQDNMDWGRKYGRGALHLLHVTAQNSREVPLHRTSSVGRALERLDTESDSMHVTDLQRGPREMQTDKEDLQARLSRSGCVDVLCLLCLLLLSGP